MYVYIYIYIYNHNVYYDYNHYYCILLPPGEPARPAGRARPGVRGLGLGMGRWEAPPRFVLPQM